MWGDERPVSLRVSAMDYLKDGMKSLEMVKIINLIKELVKEILNNKRADLVALGLDLFRNPYWVNQVAYENKALDYTYPKIYEEAYCYRK